MCRRMRGLSAEEKAYEISKEIAFWGTGTGTVLLLHRFDFGWAPATEAAVVLALVVYIIASVFRPGHLPRMVQNHRGVTRDERGSPRGSWTTGSVGAT
jgi:hypothetical protein